LLVGLYIYAIALVLSSWASLSLVNRTDPAPAVSTPLLGKRRASHRRVVAAVVAGLVNASLLVVPLLRVSARAQPPSGLGGAAATTRFVTVWPGGGGATEDGGSNTLMEAVGRACAFSLLEAWLLLVCVIPIVKWALLIAIETCDPKAPWLRRAASFDARPVLLLAVLLLSASAGPLVDSLAHGVLAVELRTLGTPGFWAWIAVSLADAVGWYAATAII
jgi:hypothetical protein